MKKVISCLLAAALAVSVSAPLAGAVYADVPASSTLASEVEKASDYGLMNGYSASNFGYADSITRAQFVTILHRMFGWSGSGTHVAMYRIPGTMEVPNTLSDEYLYAIEQAAQRNIVDTSAAFRPNDPITRGEMAEMLVRALGLGSAAAISERENRFTDVTSRSGFISVAYDIGMTKGLSDSAFGPDRTATRAQAAAMLVRIYEKRQQELGFVHGFYAISSYNQLNFAQDMDAVSAGWSRMTWDGTAAALATTSAGGNEYMIPSGYQSVTASMDSGGIALNLNVFMDGQPLKEMLSSKDGRAQAVEQILKEVTISYQTIGKNPYSGVTIDFEGLRSSQKADFTAFLTDLSAALAAMDKTLYVCVSPVLASGSYYDGYDYEAIGKLADKVILMAYDYEDRDMSSCLGAAYTVTTPTSPMDQVYWSLRSAAEQIAPTMLLLVFSCKNIACKIDENGRLAASVPIYPSNETVQQRLSQASTTHGWSETYQTPYAIYTSEDGSRYFLWYEDSRSVQAKLDTAKLLGVTGVSLWRLGTLPMYSDWNWMNLLHS